ncbi:MAG TPA: branched-chain amino acid ABC transporter substrate-binding protein [Coriobacteriia bacterium]|nr:branched-chain amino acid ABC transporter substrate-binding protein [Coriobacteriia bacterium]
MAVDNQMTVDGIGKSKEPGELILLIADHLDWADEKEHLTLLQNKINAYALFIESKQYKNIYGDDDFSSFVIQIMYLHTPSERARKFVVAAGEYLKSLNIRIITDTVG